MCSLNAWDVAGIMRHVKKIRNKQVRRKGSLGQDQVGVGVGAACELPTLAFLPRALQKRDPLSLHEAPDAQL